MIRKVKFSNFYSFYKEQEISFLANKKKTYDYYQSKSGDQIAKIAGFVGGNASGKTNVMRFFSFLSYFVCKKADGESPLAFEIACKTFFNNDSPSTFYIEFEKENNLYFYDFSVKKNVILKESLHTKKIQKGAKKIEIFSRQSSAITTLHSEYFKNISIDSLPKIREDVSLITFIKRFTAYNIDIINIVYDYFLRLQTNINEKGEVNPYKHQVRTLVDIYLKDPSLKKEVENLIRHFDVGLTGFKIEKEEVKEKGFSISVRGIHSVKVKNNMLDFEYESRGTQSLFFVIANILNALKNNNVVIVDEIESGFHPEALSKLISYFIDENRERHAQLVFSSHSLGFMNKLDMHQIFLAEKNSNSESAVSRLNEVEGIRTDENFLAKYMTGAYGAFPKIRI